MGTNVFSSLQMESPRASGRHVQGSTAGPAPALQVWWGQSAVGPLPRLPRPPRLGDTELSSRRGVKTKGTQAGPAGTAVEVRGGAGGSLAMPKAEPGISLGGPRAVVWHPHL